MKKMRNIFKDKAAFTLLEMLMVMFIIAVLLMLTIPNITKHKEGVDERGCLTYADTVQTQVSAYEMAEGKLPGSLEELVNAGYIPSTTCKNGTALTLSGSDVNLAQ